MIISATLLVLVIVLAIYSGRTSSKYNALVNERQQKLLEFDKAATEANEKRKELLLNESKILKQEEQISYSMDLLNSLKRELDEIQKNKERIKKEIKDSIISENWDGVNDIIEGINKDKENYKQEHDLVCSKITELKTLKSTTEKNISVIKTLLKGIDSHVEKLLSTSQGITWEQFLQEQPSTIHYWIRAIITSVSSCAKNRGFIMNRGIISLMSETYNTVGSTNHVLDAFRVLSAAKIIEIEYVKSSNNQILIRGPKFHIYEDYISKNNPQKYKDPISALGAVFANLDKELTAKGVSDYPAKDNEIAQKIKKINESTKKATDSTIEKIASSLGKNPNELKNELDIIAEDIQKSKKTRKPRAKKSQGQNEQ